MIKIDFFDKIYDCCCYQGRPQRIDKLCILQRSVEELRHLKMIFKDYTVNSISSCHVYCSAQQSNTA